MMTYSATLRRVRGDDPDGADHVVVDQADPVIWLSDELMEDASRAERERISGDLDIKGDLIRFGTSGEGLGRLTYRLVGHDDIRGVYIAKREP
jgi:hypothetical protein